MPLISGLVSAILSKKAADDATQANIQMNAENNMFNAGQAQIARSFEAGQAALTRQFNADEAAKQRGFSATEAQKVRDFEKYMSNTQYQRAFADAKAAGINPVAALLAQGGAGTPSVAAASGTAASGPSVHGTSASSANFAGAKVPDFSGIANMGSGLAAVAQSAMAVKTLKQLGNVKTVADVSKILTNAKTAKSIAALAKFIL